MRQDQRSPEAKAWRGLYNLAVWKRARSVQLHKQPLCELCQKAGRITPANVVNHRIPHKGDWALFTNPSNHQSVCKPHHDSTIQGEEHRGYSGEADQDGFPTDPRHPFNGGKIV